MLKGEGRKEKGTDVGAGMHAAIHFPLSLSLSPGNDVASFYPSEPLEFPLPTSFPPSLVTGRTLPDGLSHARDRRHRPGQPAGCNREAEQNPANSLPPPPHPHLGNADPPSLPPSPLLTRMEPGRKEKYDGAVFSQFVSTQLRKAVGT